MIAARVKQMEIKKIIKEKLISPPISSLSKEESQRFTLEQYKLIVDSAHKMEENRRGSNNIFIAINSIFATTITQIVPFPEIKVEKLILLAILLPIGIGICWDWLRTIESYKKINYVSYCLIKALETLLPASVFTLQTELVAEPDDPTLKANIVLNKEKLLPIVFIAAYLIYFIFIFLLLYLNGST